MNSTDKIINTAIFDESDKLKILKYINSLAIDTPIVIEKPDALHAYHQASQILLSSPDAESISKKLLMQAEKLLTPLNLPEFWQKVILINDIPLMNFCQDFFSKNFKDVEMKNFDVNQMTIIADSTTISNIDKLEIIVKWITTTTTMPEQNIKILLLEKINFLDMTCKTMIKYSTMLNATDKEIYLRIMETQCTKKSEFNVAIGIYGKTYPNFRVVNRIDLNEEFRVKLNTDLKNYNGVLALDDIRLNNDNDKNKTIIRTDDSNINFNKCLCALKKEVDGGEFCNIYSAYRANYFLSVDKIESIYIGNVEDDEIYAFFIRS